MEKKYYKAKQLKKDEKSPPKRIPKNLLEKIEKRGGGKGRFREGLYKMDTICEMVEKDPSLVLQNKLEEYIGAINAFASENHYEHFIESGISAVLYRFNKTGRIDKNLLFLKRPEKSIDDFEEKKDQKEEENE